MRLLPAVGSAALCALLPFTYTFAQDTDLSAYYLNVGYAAAETDLTESALTSSQYGRAMGRFGMSTIGFRVAYEQSAIASTSSSTSILAGLSPGASGGDWLPLQGTLAESGHVDWRHRLDRLYARWEGPALEITAGRQPISWATALFLTPSDPFAPFDPSDPFREYRRGVDAARVRWFTGPFSHVEVAARVSEFGPENTLTVLGRGRTALGKWDLSGWAGLLHDDPAAAAGITLTVLGAAFRGEAVVRDTEGETIIRATVGVDRSYSLGSRMLYLAAEFQHDGFGAANAAELPAVLQSAAAARGELQVYGRHELVLRGEYDIHPLVRTDFLTIWNLCDGSFLLGPGVSYSMSGETDLRGGLFFGLGDGATAGNLPGSEYGLVPTSGYLALTVFL